MNSRTGTREAYDAELVIARLEEAGRVLLSLPHAGARSRVRSAWPDVVQDMTEAYGYTEEALRAPVPSAAGIGQMDEALGWIRLIPLDVRRPGSGQLWSTHGGATLRRIVGARALVSPTTDRYLFSWRRIGDMIGADGKAVKRWHCHGIDAIVGILNSHANSKITLARMSQKVA